MVHLRIELEFVNDRTVQPHMEQQRQRHGLFREHKQQPPRPAR
jgi:hypothetical protein